MGLVVIPGLMECNMALAAKQKPGYA